MKPTRNGSLGIIPISERLGLSRTEAAVYVGFCVDLFDEMVKDGRMPKPKMCNSKKVWSRPALVKAFTDLPEEGRTPTEDQWSDAAA